jgi:hypothetical protein
MLIIIVFSLPAFNWLAVLSQIATIYVAIKVFRGEA